MNTSKVNSFKNENSKNDIKYIDLLDEDKPISGQKFVCLRLMKNIPLTSSKCYLFICNMTHIFIINEFIFRLNLMWTNCTKCHTHGQRHT